MPDPNRYHLAQYSPAELAALNDEPLLWWLVWQAMGDGVIDCGDCQYIERHGSWHKDDDCPRENDDSRPTLEAVLDALGKVEGAEYFANLSQRTIININSTGPLFTGASLYLAACRALLAWKRGQG